MRIEKKQVRHTFQRYTKDLFIVRGKKRREKGEGKEGKEKRGQRRRDEEKNGRGKLAKKRG